MFIEYEVYQEFMRALYEILETSMGRFYCMAALSED